MNLQTPKAGDRVKIVKAYDESGEEYITQEGTVLYATPPEYDVSIDGLGGGYMFYDGELEVIKK